MTQALGKADAQVRLFLAGVDIVVGTPEEFAATIKSDMTKWGKLIRDAGIRSE
jgi:tripartite-type tricarboxylate transporter receptor subunit TctC